MRTIYFLAWLIAAPLLADDGLRLEKFEYPFPTKVHRFTSQGQELEMVYMDLAGPKVGAETVVLLHGKNFSGAYWKDTALALQKAGYRVVIPDQLGFGKSSKPEHYHYSFAQLAANTRDWLASIEAKNIHLMGHSMGGMLATRYALMFPAEVRTLTLIDPIGLEDWKARGVPYRTVDQWYEDELKQTAESLRTYQRESYYHGEWRTDYEPWVQMQLQFIGSSQYPRMAWNQARIYEMIYTQPVCYEFDRLMMPVLLVIGTLDRTAIGKQYADPMVRPRLGNYPVLARDAVKKMPHGQLIELEGLGHVPQLEAFPRFIGPVQNFLATNKPRLETRQ